MTLSVLLSLPSYGRGRGSHADKIFKPISFQGGMVAVAPFGSNSFVYGPFAALTPMLDFGYVGLRAEAAISQLRLSGGSPFYSLSWGAYVWVPAAMALSSRGGSGLMLALFGFSFEFGGGMETWGPISNGWQPEATASLMIRFPSAFERLSVGYTYFFIPNAPAQIVRATLGFAF